MIRAALAFACVAPTSVVGVEAAVPDGQFSDEDVAASQRFFSLSWREHHNKGDVGYCGNSYATDASLRASLALPQRLSSAW